MYHLKLKQGAQKVSQARDIDKIVSIPELEKECGTSFKNTVLAFCGNRGDVLKYHSPIENYYVRVERM